jgi:hypothetical protein
VLGEYFFDAYKSFEGLQVPTLITRQTNFYWRVMSFETRSVNLMRTQAAIPAKPASLSPADILQSSLRFVAGSLKGQPLSALQLDDELLDPAGAVIAQRSRIVASEGRLRLTEKRAGRIEVTVLDNGRCRHRSSADAPVSDCTAEVEFHAIQAAHSFPALRFWKECTSNANASRGWTSSDKSHYFYYHCGASPSEGWTYTIAPSGRIISGGYSVNGPDSLYATSIFDDWRTVAGVSIPFRADIESRRPEIEGVAMRVIAARVNPKVDDKTFRLD